MNSSASPGCPVKYRIEGSRRPSVSSNIAIATCPDASEAARTWRRVPRVLTAGPFAPR
jgi:hypothetical protein